MAEVPEKARRCSGACGWRRPLMTVVPLYVWSAVEGQWLWPERGEVHVIARGPQCRPRWNPPQLRAVFVGVDE